MKKQLDQVTKKINVEEYSLKEVAEYFINFDNYICIIKTKNKTIKFKMYKDALPHLIGLQYFSNIKKYKGNQGLNLLLNDKISLPAIKNSLKHQKNYNKIINNIILRIEYLPMFLNTIITNSRIKKLEKNKIIRNTLLKGNYLLFKQIKGKGKILFPLFSLKHIKENNYVIETFIVEDNISLLGALNEEKIIDIKLIPPKVKEKNFIYN